MHLLPPFRRRIVPVPFQLHHPVWIEDPAFDLHAPEPYRITGGLHDAQAELLMAAAS